MAVCVRHRREPQLVATHNLSKLGQDAHGVIVDPASSTLWIAHRVSSNVTIHPSDYPPG